MDITPFNKLPLIKYFQHDLEKIMMAYRLSDSIRGDVKNIRAAGDQVEVAVKKFFYDKLHPNFYVGDGHIVDKNLKVSPQFDLIICENRKNPILFSLADKSDLIYYEPVFLYGEIKRSVYDKELFNAFARNNARMRSELSREELPPNYIETNGAGLIVGQDLTSLPMRNPILSFMFFIDSRKLRVKYLKTLVDSFEKADLPNFIVFLDQGIFINVNSQALADGKIHVNLYPQYEEGNNEWIMLPIQDSHVILVYQYMLVLDHLNSAITSKTDILEYTKNMFNFPTNNIVRI